MKQYAVFINGVRGGTITFNNTSFGEELRTKMIDAGLSIRELTNNKPTTENPRIGTHGSVGGLMVRKMIEAYEGKRQ